MKKILMIALFAASCGTDAPVSGSDSDITVIDNNGSIDVGQEDLAQSDAGNRDTSTNDSASDGDGTTQNSPYDPCVGNYSEDILNLDQGVDDLIGGYTEVGYHAMVKEAIERRAPYAAWIVEQQMSSGFDCIAEYAGPYAIEGPESMLRTAVTVVHECSHGINMDEFDFVNHSFYVTFDNKQIIDVVQGPERRVIKTYLPYEDQYTETYLDLSGEQLFDMVLEELNGYTQGLIVGIAFVDVAYEGRILSHRDGVAALQLFTAVYLRHIKTNDTTAYDAIVGDPKWRTLILTLWDRSQYILELADAHPALGLRDDEVRAEIPTYVDEIETIRSLHCP